MTIEGVTSNKHAAFEEMLSEFKETKVVTGVIEEYKQRDGKWYDVISGGTTKS